MALTHAFDDTMCHSYTARNYEYPLGVVVVPRSSRPASHVSLEHVV